ncbi:hypothetical protein LIER_41554 [Lithospermum erythrorhizon]
MNYVEFVTYLLLINGDQVGYITPGRGLRQGHPLSPYLFIICTEGLISLLKEACSSGELKGIKVGPSLEPMTHLMFVDDTLLLGSATLSEAAKFKSILDIYESWSGQLVNAQKSTLLFRPNVSGTTRVAILAMLGMTEVNSHEKYLGLPTTIASSKKKVFSTIVDRVKAKVANWKPRILSTTGKEVFIISVLQSISTFTMKYFRLPLQTCNEINFILANFWWGSDTSNKKKIHWLTWQCLCKQKSEGGMGFRDTQSFNQALLWKQAWKLITEPNSPLSQVYKDRYFPRTSFWAAQLGPKPSYTWRSILSAKDLICKGLE